VVRPIIRLGWAGPAADANSRGTGGRPGRYRRPRSGGSDWSRGRRNRQRCRAGDRARNCGGS